MVSCDAERLAVMKHSPCVWAEREDGRGRTALRASFRGLSPDGKKLYKCIAIVKTKLCICKTTVRTGRYEEEDRTGGNGEAGSVPGPWGEKASGGRRPGAVRKRGGKAARMPEETAAVRGAFKPAGRRGRKRGSGGGGSERTAAGRRGAGRGGDGRFSGIMSDGCGDVSRVAPARAGFPGGDDA